jgi:hypothetical protein
MDDPTPEEHEMTELAGPAAKAASSVAASGVLSFLVPGWLRDRSARGQIKRQLDAIAAYEQAGLEPTSIQTPELGLTLRRTEEARNAQHIRNVVGVLDAAQEALSDGPDLMATPVDQAFAERLLENSRYVGNVDLQALWGRTLAAEVAQPGSVSLRTLERLRHLSVDEALAFERVCAMRVYPNAVLTSRRPGSRPEGHLAMSHTTKDWDAYYDEHVATQRQLDLLVDAGLLVDGIAGANIEQYSSREFDFTDGRVMKLKIVRHAGLWMRKVPVMLLTPCGLELEPAVRLQEPAEMVSKVQALFATAGITAVPLHRVVAADGTSVDWHDPVEAGGQAI